MFQNRSFSFKGDFHFVYWEGPTEGLKGVVSGKSKYFTLSECYD